MRRHDREVTNPADILAIIEGTDSCRLGLVDRTGDTPLPYVVALNFGYAPKGADALAGTFYFHGAVEGRKLDLIRQYPHAVVQLDGEHQPVKGAESCNWGMKYASVVAFGLARIVEELAERQRGLECLMSHYLRLWGPAQNASDPLCRGSTSRFAFPALQDTSVFCVDVERLSAKRKP